MFKQIVTDLIGQQLESFIENFDSNSIHFTGFPSSNLRLNHLRIKPDALSALQLPVVLKHGYVGSLHVVIPFAGLKSTPVQAWSSADQPLHGRVTLKPVTLKHLSTAQQYGYLLTYLCTENLQINLENVFIVAGLVEKFDGQEHIKGRRKATDQAILAANVAEEASRVLELEHARREVTPTPILTLTLTLTLTLNPDPDPNPNPNPSP